MAKAKLHCPNKKIANMNALVIEDISLMPKLMQSYISTTDIITLEIKVKSDIKGFST